MSTPLAGSPGLLRRSISGNALASSALSAYTGAVRRQDQERSINLNSSSSNIGNAAYRASLVSRYAEDLDRRRRAERAAEECRTEGNILIAHSTTHRLSIHSPQKLKF